MASDCYLSLSVLADQESSFSTLGPLTQPCVQVAHSLFVKSKHKKTYLTLEVNPITLKVPLCASLCLYNLRSLIASSHPLCCGVHAQVVGVESSSTHVNTSHVAFEHLYWALLQHFSNLFTTHNDLFTCPTCFQQHNATTCPFRASNLALAPAEQPQRTLQIAHGVHLPNHIKESSGSRSYLYCKLWADARPFIAAGGSDGSTWYGQVQLFFTCWQGSLIQGKRSQLAYVKWLDRAISGDARQRKALPFSHTYHTWEQAVMGVMVAGRLPAIQDCHSVIEISSITRIESFMPIGDYMVRFNLPK
jgi:hypothetical protein